MAFWDPDALLMRVMGHDGTTLFDEGFALTSFRGMCRHAMTRLNDQASVCPMRSLLRVFNSFATVGTTPSLEWSLDLRAVYLLLPSHVLCNLCLDAWFAGIVDYSDKKNHTSFKAERLNSSFHSAIVFVPFDPCGMGIWIKKDTRNWGTGIFTGFHLGTPDLSIP